MESVGEKLRQARLQKKLSFEEVYRRTRVHPHVLEALEQDRAHNFLSHVYIKGFLKTYAQYLGLDSERLFQEYMDSQKIEHAPELEPEEKKEKTASQFNPTFILRISLACILGIGLVFYLRYALKKIPAVEQRPPVEKTRKVVAPRAMAPISTEDLILEVRTKEDCWIRVKADGQSIFGRTLRKGSSERWQAKERLELRIGKPEALEVSFNGKPVDLKKVKVKKGLIVTREGIRGK
jgi:cytoskeletal protein RodZ